MHDSIARRDAFWEQVFAEQKAEFIQGHGIFYSPVFARHGFASRAITKSLTVFLGPNQIGDYFYEKHMVRFDSNDYEPDIIFYLNDKLKEIKPNTLIHPIPDFIVEIVSESTERNDRGIKMLDYASHGVGEYWIVDPDRKTVKQYLLGSRKMYAPGQVLRQSGFLASEVITGWSVEFSTLWQD
jgi:Uma2 family endonuclease